MQAINNYMKQSNSWNQCVVSADEINNKTVPVQYRGILSNYCRCDYVISWNLDEDYARIGVKDSDVMFDIFHLTECLDNTASLSRDWKSVYISALKGCMSFLKGYTSSNGFEQMFDLCDINGDGIPELLVSNGTAHVNRVEIYVIDNDELINLGQFGEYGETSINCKHNLVASYTLYFGHCYETYLKLEENKLVELLKLFNDAVDVGFEKAKYTVNGNQVTNR